jgi:deoxyribonuclease-4
MYLGAHESAAGGPYRAVGRALDDGCESLQIFVKNNNRWSQRPWRDEEAEKFRTRYAESGLHQVMAHAAYLLNPCSPRDDVREKTRAALADELTRCQQLGVPLLVMHPGSTVDDRSDADALSQVAAEVNIVYAERGDEWPDVTLLFENTAGQGSNLGWRHEHLRDLMGMLEDPDPFGICFDTCHAHAAGYDLTDEEKYDAHWAEFDTLVGLEWLRAFHLNDSQRELGSRVDRHEHIGDGEIGYETFRLLVNDERFASTPAVVETPKFEGADGYEEDIRRLKDLRG